MDRQAEGERSSASAVDTHRGGGQEGTLGQTLRTWRRRIVGAVLVASGIVALQNLDPVEIQVFFWTVPALPKVVLIAIAFALGALTLWLAQSLRPRPKR